MEQNNLEINAVHGGRKDTNFKIRNAENRIDIKTAQEEAFGNSIPEKELEQMERGHYKSAMELVRAKGVEAEAKTEFSNELKEKLVEKFNIDERLIKIISATGTPLDRLHKISAWVEIDDYGRKIIITLDIFTDEENKRDRADVIFQKPECGFNPKVNSEEYKETLNNVVEDIIDKFKIKTNQSRKPKTKAKGLEKNTKINTEKIIATKPTFIERKTADGKSVRRRPKKEIQETSTLH